ncbi:putative entry exclusion protein TrbK-alt [Agrobacterium tumefaciens]|jgi:conjugative transfer region protein TrbK|uniref:putative entry exclusion protein TrbK-alt n=1 Tax=Rhizobiaceae TaxID=82115 RepID=UPI000DD9AFA0|nr:MULTISPECIES: putative entry exclusion protein TrbK-alt [Hyphomicrobiales]MDG4672898.1 putative entry exclusion protein TrbK-alt [Shinella sp. 838]MDX3928065.1 putative entry exclusion protein TrbK-alt [Shinella sp.]WKL22192.1 putative entry exclusion protein TrbK-alt [Agrobacterium tumefaciens]
MDGKVLARIAAIIFVAVAITAAIIEMTREEKAGPAPAAPGLQPAADPLRLEQRRCQEMGEAAANDATCLRVWAETRDRFLGRSPAPEAPAESGGR